MFEIRTRQTSDGPRYDIINTETGLPVVIWYNAGNPNELADYKNRPMVEKVYEQLNKGYMHDLRASKGT